MNKVPLTRGKKKKKKNSHFKSGECIFSPQNDDILKDLTVSAEGSTIVRAT